MAIALPAFLNQANKPKALTASSSHSETDALTGMGETWVGAASTRKTLRPYTGIVSTTSSAEPLTPQQSGIYLGTALERSPTQGSQSQAEGVIAWSIRFADVVRPSSSASGAILPADGRFRGTLLL